MPKHSSIDNTGIDETEPNVAPVEPTPISSVADNPIGLTEAFSPVSFDDEASHNELSEQQEQDEPAAGAHAAPEPFEPEELEQSDGAETMADGAEEDSGSQEEADTFNPAAQQFAFDKKAAKKREKEMAKAAKKANKVQYSKKGRRVRTALIIVVILLIALLAAAVVGVVMIMQEVQSEAVQQTVEQQDDSSSTLSGGSTTDTTTEATKVTEVPVLTSVLGKTQDEAVAELQHGATVTSSRAVNEEGNDIKTSVTVALTDEPADSRSGTPTVYLGLNEGGQVIEAGYSAATASLGYGSLSFSDAVNNEHIVEKTLQEAGVGVAEGTITLPTDKTEYSTYASDGTTLTKESYTFTGTASANGAEHEWSSVLMYDYTTANTSGNLADTIRMIYVYVEA